MPIEKAPAAEAPWPPRPDDKGRIPEPYPLKGDARESFYSISDDLKKRGIFISPIDLVKFNFRTTNPAEANWYLRKYVGCKAPTRDGKNYSFAGVVFSDREPNRGLIYVPAKSAPKAAEPKPANPEPGPNKPGVYNRLAAAAYARRYAKSANPAYPEFHNDCTSFVSQALLAGGWTMVGEGTVYDYNNDDVWWYGRVDKDEYDGGLSGLIDLAKDLADYGRPALSEVYRASQTWAGAPMFARFLQRSGRGFRRPSADKLRIGDVIQEYDKSKNKIIHTMIVIGKDHKDIEYAQHTDGAIRKFYERFPSGQPKDPNHEFWFWALQDRIQYPL